jgi:multiple sugar transport system ATP-binding protein
MADLRVENLSKTFGRVRAVNDLHLHAQTGELLAIVGPSGCGKTTLLRLIAGLEKPDAGTISIDGTIVNRKPPHKRNLALTFQDHSLYPHMTVRRNMAFPLRMRGVSRSEVRKCVDEAASLLGLTDLLDRKPGQLSGGESQRAALGRAIVLQRGLWLLDEPLAHLDANLRMRLRSEIKSLQHRLGVTVVFVTHDQEEAMALGDRVAVMAGGCVLQIGPAIEVYHRPTNRFVAGFLGRPAMNFFQGRLAKHGRDVVFHHGVDVHLTVDAGHAEAIMPWLERDVVMGIRPENVRAVPIGRPCRDQAIGAKVTSAAMFGGYGHVVGRLPEGGAITAMMFAHEDAETRPDQAALFEVHSPAMQFFEPGDFGVRIG